MASHLTGPLLNRGRSQGLREWYSNMPLIDDPDYAWFFNDFLKATDYSTTDFTLTLVGTGTAAASTSALNGALALVTTGASSDSNSLQGKQVAYKLEAGKRMWFECNVQASNVADVDLIIGLAVTDTTPLDASDRAVFKMTNGAATLSFESTLASTTTTLATGASLIASTNKKLGFYFDGAALNIFVDRSNVGKITTNIPTAAMCLTAHVKTNSANARTVLVDYLFLVKER